MSCALVALQKVLEMMRRDMDVDRLLPSLSNIRWPDVFSRYLWNCRGQRQSALLDVHTMPVGRILDNMSTAARS